MKQVVSAFYLDYLFLTFILLLVKALASLPLESERLSSDEDDLSPDTPLPIYQQRDNFYS